MCPLRPAFTEFVTDFKLTKAHSVAHSVVGQPFTWTSPRDDPRHIDFILFSIDSQVLVADFTYHRYADFDMHGRDHIPISTALRFTRPPSLTAHQQLTRPRLRPELMLDAELADRLGMTLAAIPPFPWSRRPDDDHAELTEAIHDA